MHSDLETPACTAATVDAHRADSTLVSPESRTLLSLVAGADWEAAAALISGLESTVAHSAMRGLSSLERMQVFRALNSEASVSVAVFTALRPSELSVLVCEMDEDALRHVFGELSVAARVSIVETLAQGAVERVLPLLRDEEAELVRPLLGFSEGTVGRLMHVLSNVVLVRGENTVGQLLEQLRARKASGEAQPLAVYVVDDDRRVQGEVPSHELSAAPLDEEGLARPVSELASPPLLTVEATSPVHLLLDEVRLLHRDLHCIPAVGERGELVGVVTMYEVVQQTELAGARAAQTRAAMDSDTQSYSKMTVVRLVRKRVVWLLVLLVLNMGSAGILSAFEEVLEENISLAYFIPLLVDMGGNTGSQVATLLVSALSSRDVAKRDWCAVLRNELKVAFMLCAPLAASAWLVGIVVTTGDVSVSIVIGVTMVLVVNASNFLGSILPFICVTLRLDPAVVSSPLITSIMDALGLVLYFLVALTIL